MQLKRLFSTAQVKNTYGYIDSQKKYELIRTVLYFGISISLYISGYITTNTNVNVLTVVAVLGCLPASKSLVSMIMFFKYHSCSEVLYKEVSNVSEYITHQLYDLVFTSESKTFVISHCAYKNKTLILCSEKETDVTAFSNHLNLYLKRAGIKGVHFTLYCDSKKYVNALSELNMQSETDEHFSSAVIQLLKEITL